MPGRLRHPRGVFIVMSALFLALAGFSVAGLLPADVALREMILAMATPVSVRLMRVVNAAGDWRVLLPGTLALFTFPRARHRWWLWAVLMLVAAAVPDGFKWLIARPRPEDLSFGFPSGHATAAAAFFGAVIYLAGGLAPPATWLLRTAALTLIVLVGIARVMLRAHWPSDVLGGIALGLALASAAVLLDAVRDLSSSSAARARAPTGN